MHMIGKNADRQCSERPALPHLVVDTAEAVDFPYQQFAGTIRKCQREKEGAACNFRAPIVGHDAVLCEAVVVGSALSRLSPPYKKNARLDYVCAKCAGIFSPIATLAVISALGVGWANARFRAVSTKKTGKG